jgi:hypothetical protein
MAFSARLPNPSKGYDMFKAASGLNYYRFLKRLHENFLFDWYMEVGCRAGKSFSLSRSKTIAVDPFFRAEINIITAKPELYVFQKTSDDFFGSGFLARNKIKLSVSFLDGMHLVEYLLRDFIATEQASNSKGVILMHDTAPSTAAMTMRDFRAMPAGNAAWTGDVWKLVPILQKYRPDLTLQMLDCRPTGLLMVTGLDPKNRVLSQKYAQIIAEWKDLTIEDYGIDRFANSFEFTSALDMTKANFPQFEAVRLNADAQAIPTFASP